ncbi:hypothetical protein FB561_7093 [Kribbella amoyensis]|uniref:4-amino-4-deoxy-L-arabinose transferase-like glycosyltransferase n=1 Tax=Kribbella amoyensis TaxID=996641 RepID=A0A561B2W8_9ACTN|nr:hypothetical protein [Kribbella amoyensis]TWD73205.1 hypothetical protein FB561_7093 [Kribbella amoyensis]
MDTLTATPVTVTRRPTARWLPWALPLVVAVAGLLSTGVPPGALLRYALYFAGCLVLPGVLLLRALWRSTGNWAEDVGLGTVVGCAFQLAGWALFTALGIQSALIAWPLTLLAVFAALPALRAHWRITEPQPLPLWWTWGLVIAATVAVGGATFGVFAYHPMPPDGVAYYPDLLYHLSMVNELVRSVPPQLPQVAGESLDYHWFANADMAAAVDITKLSPILVLYRLWLIPLLVVALLVCATLARTISRAWWTGVLAAAALAGPQVGLLVGNSVDLWPPLSLISPSQTFGLLAGTVAAVFLVELLFRGRQPKGLWILAIAVALVGGGAKPTILPILIGAVGLAALFLLVRDRRLPRRFVVAGALLVASGVGTMLTVAGSTSGSGVQFLAVVKLQAGYRAATADATRAGEGGLLLPALASGRTLSVIGGLVILGLLLIAQATALAGYAVLGNRRLRCDPLGWFLLGGLVAGWAGFLLVDHPSASESYFVRSVVPFSLAALAWLAATLMRQVQDRRRTAFLVAAVSTGLAISYGAALLWTKGRPTGPQLDRLLTVARPMIAVALLTVVVVLLWPVLTRRWPRLAGLGGIIALVTVLLVPTATTTAINVRRLGGHHAQTFSAAPWRVSADEADAALWLAQNARPTDVVATNTYCRPPGPQRPGCDARGYVVSGIGGRRALIEGWAYTQEAMARQNVNGRRYTEQPSPWPDRVAATERALYQPSPAALERLRDHYRVRWLYADLHDGPVSPALDHLAQRRHSIGMVRIYELPTP